MRRMIVAASLATYSGTWKAGNGRVCLTFKDKAPDGMTNPFCADVVAHKVGNTWKAAERMVKLVKGIQ